MPLVCFLACALRWVVLVSAPQALHKGDNALEFQDGGPRFFGSKGPGSSPSEPVTNTPISASGT